MERYNALLTPQESRMTVSYALKLRNQKDKLQSSDHHSFQIQRYRDELLLLDQDIRSLHANIREILEEASNSFSQLQISEQLLLGNRLRPLHISLKLIGTLHLLPGEN